MVKAKLQLFNSRIIEKSTILLSLACFVSALFFPAFYIDRQGNPEAWADSVLLLFMGVIFPLGGAFVPFLFWLANPIYIIAIIFTMRKNSKGLYLSCTSLILAVIFSQMDTIMTSESGHSSKIISLELGFKLWLISFVILTAGNFLRVYSSKMHSGFYESKST